MARIVVANCAGGWAIPYDTQEEADAAVFKLVKEAIGATCKTPQDLRDLSEEIADGSQFTYDPEGGYYQTNEMTVEGKEWLDLVTLEEGEVGVATSFDSGSRECFAFSLPIGKGINTGSGDPFIILTKGIKSGLKVEGYEAQSVDYDMYLGGQDVNEDEFDR